MVDKSAVTAVLKAATADIAAGHDPVTVLASVEAEIALILQEADVDSEDEDDD